MKIYLPYEIDDCDNVLYKHHGFTKDHKTAIQWLFNQWEMKGYLSNLEMIEIIEDING